MTYHINKFNSIMTDHINEFNSIISRLIFVYISFDDEVHALLLLSSLPYSWYGTVTTISSSSKTTMFTFYGIQDLIFTEEKGRKPNIRSNVRGSQGRNGNQKDESILSARITKKIVTSRISVQNFLQTKAKKEVNLATYSL